MFVPCTNPENNSATDACQGNSIRILLGKRPFHFSGVFAWNCLFQIELFDDENHPKAKRCYALSTDFCGAGINACEKHERLG
jgi:hypothetical protein